MLGSSICYFWKCNSNNYISFSVGKNGIIRVSQLTVWGSILLNMLLVLEVAFFCGGLLLHGKDRFFSKVYTINIFFWDSLFPEIILSKLSSCWYELVYIHRQVLLWTQDCYWWQSCAYFFLLCCTTHIVRCILGSQRWHFQDLAVASCSWQSSRTLLAFQINKMTFKVS